MNENDKSNPKNETMTNENVVKEFLPLLKEFLKDTNINQVVKTYYEGKKNEVEAKKQANKNDLKFWTYKFSKDTIITLMILCTVITLSLYDKIDNCTLGTLLGSIIGYSVGNFKSNSSNH